MRSKSGGQAAGLIEFANNYIQSLIITVDALALEDLALAVDVLEGVHREGRKVFLAGNGGSAATAMHMATDFTLGVAKMGGHGFQTCALTNNLAIISAIANDQDYSEIFAQQLAVLGQPSDVLIVISGSGNSPNIVRVVEEAHRIGMITIGLLGMGGGKVKSMVDFPVVVPSDQYGPIEDVHLMLNHLITAYFQQQQQSH